MLRSHIPMIASAGDPAWLQVVQGEHVSNRVRSPLTAHTRYWALFPGLIVRLPRPRSGAVALDSLVTTPLRKVGVGLCDVVTRALLVLGGKQALERVKLLLLTASRGVVKADRVRSG